MTIREILLKLSGKEISIKELEKLVDQSKNDKPVNEKLTKVVQLARSKKINRFVFKIEGAFKTLLGKKAEGKTIQFHSKDIGALDGLETYTKEEALSLGIIEGLGKLPYKDVYKTINQEILTYLKEDSLVWRKPWKDGVKIKGQTIGAQNYVTQRPYSGVNAYLIWLRNLALKNDYKYFLTAKQVKERGGALKKEAKGIVVVAFIKSTKVEEHPEDPKLTSIEIKQGLVQYLIYPLEQTTGVKPITRKTIAEDKSEDQIIVNAQTIVDNMPKLPIIKVGGSRAFYTPSGDYVQMPPKKAFNTLNEYYSTLFHELVHSTGAEKRLNRKFKPGTKFGDKDYAFEELIAELGAAYLCGVSDIKYYTLKNSAAYLKSWASHLRSEMAKDKTFFFRAVMSATKAAKYIVAETIVKTNPKAKVSVNKRKSNVKKTPINAKKTVDNVKNKQMQLFGLGSDAKNIFPFLVNNAEKFRNLKFSYNNFVHEFTNDLIAKTPIGEVNIDFDSFDKLKDRNRDFYFGLIKPTLEKPLVIIEHNGALIFLKTFIGANRTMYFVSVAREKSGELTIVSNHEQTAKGIEKKIKDGKIRWINHTFGTAKAEPPKPQSTNNSTMYVSVYIGIPLLETAKIKNKKTNSKKISKPQTPVKKSLNGIMSISAASETKFDLLGLDGEYLNLIGEACKPTSFFIYGPGGSGKSTFTLKFAHYLAQKGNKVAYVAGEQFNTPVLKKMLERLKLTDIANFHIVKNLEVINPVDYDMIVIDSKDSLDLTHEGFKKLQEEYPKQSWAILSMATKDGGFTGSEKWRNLVDTMIYCEDGIAVTGIDKNRWGGKNEIKIY